MKGMHGIIFSYEKRTDLRELIADRIHGSIPFAGDYRVIDFVLSPLSTPVSQTWASSCTASASPCWIIWAPARAGISAATTAA